MQRAASPRAIARIFSASPTRVYEAIRSGYVASHSLGRKSIVFVDDFERYLRSLPPTKSSRPRADQIEAYYAN